MFRVRLIAKIIKAVSDTVFDLINIVYHNKPLMFWEMLVSHQQAAKLLKTFELIKPVFDSINAVYHDKPLMFIRGYVSQETRLPS